MDESEDSAAFTALCLAAGPSRAERVRKVLREARETLARCRADELAEPRPDTPTPTWAEERADVLEATRDLRELCETLHDPLTEMQKGPWHSVYRAIAKWGDEECARIEEESLARKRLKMEDDA